MRAIFASVIAALLSTAALAGTSIPFVSAAAAPRLRVEIAEPLAERACAATVTLPWRDASDARFFATGPTARLDSQEKAVFTLAPLIGLRIVGGEAQLLVLGVPPRGGLHFTTSGWRPQWPLC